MSITYSDPDYVPTEITKCSETGVETASFPYYVGKAYTSKLGMQVTTNFTELLNGTHYMICCGDVMVHVNENHWPWIKRRIV